MMSVSVSVGLFARISLKPYVHSSSKFLEMLLMAVTRSSSGSVVICHAFPICG